MILFNYILIYNTFYQREGRRNLGAPFFNKNKNIYLKVDFNPLPVTKYHIKQTANLPSLSKGGCRRSRREGCQKNLPLQIITSTNSKTCSPC